MKKIWFGNIKFRASRILFVKVSITDKEEKALLIIGLGLALVAIVLLTFVFLPGRW